MQEEAEILAIESPNLLPLVRGRGAYPFLLGLTLLIYVYSHLAVTGTADHAIWGLYLVNFLFFTGAGAGAIVVAALAYALGVERFRPVARIAELAAISCLVLAMLFMTLDLGRPDRFRSLLRGAHFTSSLGWDVVAIWIYLANAMVLGYVATRPDLVRTMKAIPAGQRLYYVLALGRSVLVAATAPHERQVLQRLASIFIPAAVLLHSIPAWILRHLRAQSGLDPALIAVLFIVSTVVLTLALSLALVIMVAAFSRAFLRVPIGEEVIRDLAGILFFLLAPLGYCLFAEMQAITYESAGSHVFHEMMAGPYAPLFWFVLIGGTIVPFLLLWFHRTRMMGGIGLAAVLVVLGVLGQRWNVVVPPLLGHAHAPYTNGGYAPTGPEFFLTMGAYAVGLLVYLLLARRLPPAGGR